MAWYQPILRRGAPHPTNTTDTLLIVLRYRRLLLHLLTTCLAACARFFFAGVSLRIFIYALLGSYELDKRKMKDGSESGHRIFNYTRSVGCSNTLHIYSQYWSKNMQNASLYQDYVLGVSSTSP